MQRSAPQSPHVSTPSCAPSGLWRTTPQRLAILAPRRPRIGRFFFPHSTYEADLPAQRAQAEASPRLPCPDVHPSRPRDPQAAPREGSQAPLGLTPLGTRVQPRHRISRTRDIDEIYCQMWAEPKKLDDPEVLRGALIEAGFDAGRLLALSQTDEVKNELRANTTALNP